MFVKRVNFKYHVYNYYIVIVMNTTEKKIVKKKWSNIRVPEEVMTLLKRVKAKSGHDKAYWRILLESLAFYQGIISSPNKMMKASKVEKTSWYITKLSLAYSNFVLVNDENTYNEFMARLDEIEKRLEIDVSVIRRLAEEYKKVKDETKKQRMRIEFNQAIKLLVKEMMLMACSSEEEKS